MIALAMTAVCMDEKLPKPVPQQAGWIVDRLG
jgi:hypothetical protein